jgi:hypothetical protein
MTADLVAHGAKLFGVNLQLDDDGKLVFTSRHKSARGILPAIRTRKTDIEAHLTKERTANRALMS